jgi:hypothetical protein
MYIPQFRAVWVLLLAAVAAFSADLTGLQQRSAVKITAQMAGAPFEGDDPPFIWGISFSPDKKYLAFGVEFVRKKDLKFRSYILVVSAERPDSVMQKFETPAQVKLRHLHSIVWSRDSRFLVVTPFGDWDSAGVVDVDASQLHTVPDRIGVPWCGGAVSLLPGPRIVQQCSLAGSGAPRFVFSKSTGPPRRNGLFLARSPS